MGNEEKYERVHAFFYNYVYGVWDWSIVMKREKKEKLVLYMSLKCARGNENGTLGSANVQAYGPHMLNG